MNDEQKDNPEQDEQKTTSRFVTRLRTIERQVGENVLAALENQETVAVLTTIASGLRADRVVSVPLTRDQVENITSILQQAQAEVEDEDEAPSIGFHVVLETEEESGVDDVES